MAALRTLSGFRGTPPPSGSNTGTGISPSLVAPPTMVDPRAFQNAWLYPQTITAATQNIANGGAANAVPTANQTAAIGNAPGAFFGPTGVADAPVLFGLTGTQLVVGLLVAGGLVYVLTR